MTASRALDLKISRDLLVLLTLDNLGGEGTINQILEDWKGRAPAIPIPDPKHAARHLGALEDSGLVSTRPGEDSTSPKGGKPPGIWTLTPLGERTAALWAATFQSLARRRRS